MYPLTGDCVALEEPDTLGVTAHRSTVCLRRLEAEHNVLDFVELGAQKRWGG
jgi:hypothetical protein